VGGDESAASGDLAAGGVGNARLDAVAVVDLALGDGDGDVDGQLAVGVEPAFLFVQLVAGVVLVGVGLAHVVVLVAPDGEPEALAVDGVLHLGAGDGLAEVVAGVDDGLDGLALEDPGFGRSDADFVLGLLVLLDFEVAAHGAVARAGLEEVMA
jgi:hypothetical protein